MNKTYKVVITSVDHDTSKEEVEYDGALNNIFLIGDNAGKDSFCEMILNTNIMDIASKMAFGDKTVEVVKLANCLLDLAKNSTSKFEDMMLNAIMGGKN